MALRHSDAAMLISLPFIYINWFDIWMHISYNGAFKKNLLIWSSWVAVVYSAYLMPSELMKAEHQSCRRIFKEFFFFLWKEVIPVKYKLFFLRNIHFNFVKNFRNFWSSTERSIHPITSWGTRILNMWCLVSNPILKGQWRGSQYTFSFCL